MAALFAAVEVLVAATDRLSASANPPSESALGDVHAKYEAFLAKLAAVQHAVLGPGERPFKETYWWAQLLFRWRYYVCSLFSWGLLCRADASAATELLRGHGAKGILDPLAGSGWQARLWQDSGLDCAALDSYAFRPVAWTPVAVVADARQALDSPIPGSPWPGMSDAESWALHLSWPPHAPETVGIDLLSQWRGDYLVYLGERALEATDTGDEGLTGGRELLDAIAADWELLHTWAIPQWPGYGDDLSVYRRRRTE